MSISLPSAVRQRLGGQMADEHPESRRPSQTWTAERIAHELVPSRDRLVERLPREIAAARDLTHDQRELAVDDAIDYVVTEYAKPIVRREELDRAFWAAASYRVKRALEGRGATVRAGYRRAASEDLDRVAGSDDPEVRVIQRDEQLTLLEFVSTLTPRERQVFACKYGSGPRVAGRNQVSRWLSLPIGEVRKAERSIGRKLENFIALVSAGALCSYRRDAIHSLATDTATADQATAARLHLKHCPACQSAYAEHLRALRSGALPRDIASLLPLPVLHQAGEQRPPRGFLLDWITRPLGSQPGAIATHAASSGAGRGLGSLAAVKLASICIGGAALTGGLCVSIQDRTNRADDPTQRRDQARSQAARPQTRSLAGSSRRLTPTTSPAPASTPRKERDMPRAHETVVAVSPPAADAQAGGIDEFGPSGASTPSDPAAGATGSTAEFP